MLRITAVVILATYAVSGTLSSSLAHGTMEPSVFAGPSFPRDPLCGKNISCYGHCEGSTCDFLATWYQDDQSLVFTLKSVVTDGNDMWMAIGFNTDADMNPASVSECVANGGQIKAFMSYNDNYQNSRVKPDASVGLSDVSGSLEDEVFTCSFRRLMVVAAGDHVYNLTSKYHVLMARGKANGWNKTRHGGGDGDRFVTDNSYNLTVITDIRENDVTTEAPTTAPPGTPFPRDPSCGKNISCYGHCEGSTCDFLATWYQDDQSLVFTLKSVVTGGNDMWMAIGFNTEAAMNPASVSECVANGGQIKAFMSYNDNYQNSRIKPDASVGLSDVSGSLKDGVFICSFHRLLVVAAGDHVYNLTKKYHVLMAKGKADGWNKIPHGGGDGDRFVTDNSYNLTVVTDIRENDVTTEVPTTAPPNPKFPKDPECGKTESCYGDCKDDGCHFLSTWYQSGQSLVISLKSTTTATDEIWMAIGFGTEAKMGPASVSQCVLNTGKVQAFMSYNPGHRNRPVANETAGLSNVTGSVVNGLFSCSFHRDMVVAAGDDVYNLTQKYHVLIAKGKADGWHILPHAPDDDYVTAKAYNLSVVTDIGAKLQSFPLVKVHGCLMTLAWILSASIGVIVARFYKDTWPTQLVCNVKIWFAIHRSAMTVAFLATVAGFVVIFIDVQGFSKILGPDYQKAHPILGIVVTSLIVINPIMSLFRCSPTHECRPLFNWAHWAVGTSAYIMGVTTVGIGTRLFRAQTPEWVTYVVIGFGAWHVLVHAILEVIKCTERNDSMVGVYRDLQTFTASYDGLTYRIFRDIVFALHVVTAVGACVTIVTAIIGY